MEKAPELAAAADSQDPRTGLRAGSQRTLTLTSSLFGA
jgi:hypothetical protein